jgi:hypothetical protein
MKWVFATNQGSLEKSNNEYPRLIRAAVSSTIENATLQPFMIYDGAVRICGEFAFLHRSKKAADRKTGEQTFFAYQANQGFAG